MLAALGPLTIVAVVGLWVLLLWVGFTAVFAADPDAAVSATGREPGDLVDRVYFVGYSLFTQGNGEWVPNDGPLRSAIDTYAATLRSSHVRSSDDDPPLPDLSPLRQAGVTPLGEAGVSDAFGAVSDRRRFLLGLVDNEHVPWPSARVPAAVVD